MVLDGEWYGEWPSMLGDIRTYPPTIATPVMNMPTECCWFFSKSNGLDVKRYRSVYGQ